MSALHRRLLRALVRLFALRILEERAQQHARELLEDYGDEDCPVCLANRRRQAWTR